MIISTTTKKMNVLLVDNYNKVSRLLELQLLCRSDINSVKIAESLEIASEALSAHHTDIVIVDIQNIDGSGFNFLQSVKQTLPEVTTIMLTNHADDYHRLYAIKAGADFFVDKSKAFHELPRVIQEIVKHKS
jgi:DNA-binding NtrC family response regulator